MAKVFKSIIDINNYIESACEKAIKAVAERVTQELESYILEDFYNQYRPRFYDRTYQLLKSPKHKMIDSKTAEVFIDMDVIHYLVDDPSYSYDKTDIVKLASLGYHGTINIFRPGMFWEDFIEWCNSNVPQLMKQELGKRGIPVK